MDIAALSIAMNQAKLLQQVSIAVADKALEMQTKQMEQTTEMMTSNNIQHPTIGTVIDLQV